MSSINNIVVRAQIGEHINISCYFDPNLINMMNQAGQVAPKLYNKNERLYQLKKRQLNQETTKKYADNNNSNRIFKSANLNTETDESSLITIDGGDEPVSDGKYEIDWYFLDNQGRMNIIRQLIKLFFSLNIIFKLLFSLFHIEVKN